MSTTEGDDEEGIDPHLLLALAMLGIIKVKPPPLMKKGDQIRGYEFLGQLGEGGFGEVWAVKKNEKLFAIKVMKNEKDVAGTELIFSDKLHLKNPFLVEYFESFRSSDNALAFIVMELCKQGDLDGLVKKLDPEKGIGLQAHRIMKIFMQLILGLHELHRNNIIHRDLKLGNVFVDENDNIKIGDFGAARILNSAGELRKTMVGTPLYMSPEQFSKEAYGQSVDLWALGVMMYELCTTKMPFMAQTKAELEQKIKIGVYPPIPKLTVPNEIITAIDNLLSKDPKKRPNTTTLLKIPLIQECAKDSDLLKYFPKDVLLNKPSSPSNKGWPGGPTPSQPTSSAPKPSAPAAHPKPKGNANPAGPGGPNPNQQKPAGGKPGPGGPGGPNQWGPSGGGAGPGGPGGQNPNQWGPNGGGPGPGGPGGQDPNQWGPNGTQFGPGGRGGQNPNQWGPNGGGPGPGGPGGQNPNQWGPNGTQFGPGGRGGQNPNQWGPNGGGPGPGPYGGFAPGPYGGFPPGPYGGFPPGPPGGFAPGPYGGFPPGPPGPFQGFPPGPYPGGFPGGPCGTQFGPGGGTGSKKKITPPVSDYGSPPPSGGGGAGRKTFIWRNTNPSNDDNKIWDRIQGKYGGGINMFRVRDNAAAFQIIDGIAPAQRNLVYVASNRGSQGIEFLTECRARPHGITTPSVIFCMNKEGWVLQDWVELSVANSALDDFLEEKVKNGNW